jgi:peptidoglycan hydrolase-like protein with peptidoglycan-binding domain
MVPQGRIDEPACIRSLVAQHYNASLMFRRLGMAGLPLVPGDTGPLVTQMQGALVAKGFSVGPSGPTGTFDDDTLTALEAFQDNNALPVQPKCDQQCWTALGLAGPGTPKS